MNARQEARIVDVLEAIERQLERIAAALEAANLPKAYSTTLNIEGFKPGEWIMTDDPAFGTATGKWVRPNPSTFNP